MTTAEKLTAIAENEQKVYWSGRQDEHNDFWKSALTKGLYGNGGISGTARFAGWCWDNNTLKPPRKITLTNNCNHAFSSCGYTGSIAEMFDFVDLTRCSQMFEYASIREIGTLDLSTIADAGGLAERTFLGAQNLKTIQNLIVSENLKFTNAFNSATALENIKITGTIGTNGLNFKDCSKLTKESIESIIFALSETTSGLTLTLSRTAVNKAFENGEEENNGAESEEWSYLVDERTNWNINLA